MRTITGTGTTTADVCGTSTHSGVPTDRGSTVLDLELLSEERYRLNSWSLSVPSPSRIC